MGKMIIRRVQSRDGSIGQDAGAYVHQFDDQGNCVESQYYNFDYLAAHNLIKVSGNTMINRYTEPVEKIDLKHWGVIK